MAEPDYGYIPLPEPTVPPALTGPTGVGPMYPVNLPELLWRDLFRRAWPGSQTGPSLPGFGPAPGGGILARPGGGPSLIDQVLAPAGEEELRRVMALRALGLPPIPTAPIPSAPAASGGGPSLATQLTPAAAPTPGAADPFSAYLTSMSQATQAPLLETPAQRVGAFWSGIGTPAGQANPVLKQLVEERNAQLQRMAQIGQLGLQAEQLRLQRETATETRQQHLVTATHNLASGLLQHADTQEQKALGAGMMVRAAELAGIQISPEIVTAWKTGAATPAKNTQAMADLLMATPPDVVAQRTGLPVSVVRGLAQLEQRARQGDRQAMLAIKYATGQDYNEAVKSANDVKLQALKIAEEEIELANLTGDVKLLAREVIAFGAGYGPWRELVKDRAKVRQIITEWENFENTRAAHQAGLASVSPEATRDLIALTQGAANATQLLDLASKDPKLFEKFTGAPGMFGLQEWITQKFQGVTPTPESYGLAVAQFLENELKATVVRYRAGAAIGPSEERTYMSVIPNRSTMNAAQYKIAAQYWSKALTAWSARYAQLQSVGGKMALAAPGGSAYLTRLYHEHPGPNMVEMLESIRGAGVPTPPSGFRPARPGEQ